MARLDDSVCVFVSPHADAAKGEVAGQLRESGVHLWVWPLAEPSGEDPAPPQDIDALIVLDAGAQLPSAVMQRLTEVLRRAWSRGATIGLFCGAVELLASADIATGAAPIESPGLFIDEKAPTPGVIEEFLDAMRSGPHPER